MKYKKNCDKQQNTDQRTKPATITHWQKPLHFLQAALTINVRYGDGVSKHSKWSVGLSYQYTVVQNSCHPFSFHYSFYKCWPISKTFGTHYIELICNTPTSPTYCCCTTLGKLICCFWLSSPCASDDRAPAAWNSEIHSSRQYGLPVALILIQLTIEYGAWYRIACIRHQFGKWPIWDSTWLTVGMTYHKALWTMLLMNGARDFRPVWMKKEDILNTCCNILSWVKTGCVDKLDVLLVCATKKCNFFGKVIISATDFFCKVVQQQYVGEVGKSIIRCIAN